MKGNFQAPYNMQLFIIPKDGGKFATLCLSYPASPPVRLRKSGRDSTTFASMGLRRMGTASSLPGSWSLYKWDKGTIKELANQGCQANTVEEWPLTFRSINPWARNTVTSCRMSRVGRGSPKYTLSSVVSAFWMLQEEKEGAPAFQTCNHLDYFRRGCLMMAISTSSTL